MKTLMRVAAACLALTISAASAQQPALASRLDDILRRGTLRVGMTGDYMPFTHYDQATSQFTGFDVDMAEALGKALGVKVAFVKTSWPTLKKDFEADAFDVAMGGVSITLDRQKVGLFSDPVLREGKTPIARCADKDRFQTLADIDKPGTRVIVNPGGTNERFTREHIKSAGIQINNDNVTIFDEIAKGDADLMMTDASETLSAEAPPRRALRHPSGQAVRLRRKGLLAAARHRAQGLRRSVAAHRHCDRQLQENLR